jgi:shikimate kinase
MAKKHIFLTGFMGAGKSRVGRYLAQRLNFPFVDTDKEIEQKSGKSVKAIFEEDGEPAFRLLEKETIKALSDNPLPHVISLGGGALNDAQTFQTVRQAGLVVYLKSSPESILQRVRHTDKRPLLEVNSEKNRDAALLKRIKALLTQREPVYSQADIVIERDNMEAEEVAEYVLEQLNQFWKQNYATD